MPRTTTGRVVAGVYVLVVIVMGILAFTIPEGYVAFLCWDSIATFPTSIVVLMTFSAFGSVTAALGVNTPEWLAAILIVPAFIGAACVNVWIAGSFVRAGRFTSQGRGEPAAKAP